MEPGINVQLLITKDSERVTDYVWSEGELRGISSSGLITFLIPRTELVRITDSLSKWMGGPTTRGLYSSGSRIYKLYNRTDYKGRGTN